MYDWLDSLLATLAAGGAEGKCAVRRQLASNGLLTVLAAAGDEPTARSELESVYISDMWRVRRRGLSRFISAVTQLPGRRADHLHRACWAAALLALAHGHRSPAKAETWIRRARQVYGEYVTAANPPWAHAVMAMAGVAVPPPSGIQWNDPLSRFLGGPPSHCSADRGLPMPRHEVDDGNR